MRHEAIETTIAHYVDIDADALAEEVWTGTKIAQKVPFQVPVTPKSTIQRLEQAT